MRFSRSEPGLAISAAIHFGLLAGLLIYMSSAPKFDNAPEAVPVDMVTNAQFSQIMKGQTHAKVATGKPRVDRVAKVVEHKPTPATPKAKRDVPTPPSRLKREKKPSQAKEDHKPDLKAPVPPPRPAPAPVKTRPKHEKPPEKRADVLPAHPPPPPPRPQRRKPKPLKLDQVAKLLREIKDKPAHHRRPSGQESHERRLKPNLDEIAQMLSHDDAQALGSSGRKLNRHASLGAPNASAARMSPSLSDALSGLLLEQYRQCWSYINFSNGPKYVPIISIALQPDGSLASQPVLTNPPTDATSRMLADSALRAVHRCNPLKIPAKFRPYYQQWKDWVVRFDPSALN